MRTSSLFEGISIATEMHLPWLRKSLSNIDNSLLFEVYFHLELNLMFCASIWDVLSPTSKVITPHLLKMVALLWTWTIHFVEDASIFAPRSTFSSGFLNNYILDLHATKYMRPFVFTRLIGPVPPAVLHFIFASFFLHCGLIATRTLSIF